MLKPLAILALFPPASLLHFEKAHHSFSRSKASIHRNWWPEDEDTLPIAKKKYGGIQNVLQLILSFLSHAGVSVLSSELPVANGQTVAV